MGNAPPPFVPPAAAGPKKSNTTLIVVIILAVVGIPCVGAIVVGAVGFKFFKSDIAPMAGCMMAFEEVHEAVIDYANEHNATLPNAKTWQDDVRDNYRKVVVKNSEDRGPFKAMRADSDWGCEIGNDQMSGIAFNSEVSGKKLADIKEPRSTVLIFEVEAPGKNAARPFKALDEETSPKIFGENRGWVTVTVGGEVEMGDGSVRVDVGRRRSRGADSELPEDPPQPPTPPKTGG